MYGRVWPMELQLDLIALDSDVLSFHLPSFYPDYFLHADMTCLPWIARALLRILRGEHGTGVGGPGGVGRKREGCRSVQGVGVCARRVADLLLRAWDYHIEEQDEEGRGRGRGEDEEGDGGGMAIENIVLIDRTADLVRCAGVRAAWGIIGR